MRWKKNLKLSFNKNAFIRTFPFSLFTFALKPNTPATLIVGSDSLIGRTLVEQLRHAGARIYGTTRRSESVDESNLYLDLAEDVSGVKYPEQIDAAVICAGVTKLEACRRDPSTTARINVQAVSAIANKLAEMGARVIYLSSNAVFDGTRPQRLPDDTLSPVTEYGRQKAEAERQLSALGEAVTIVRLTKVLEPRAGLLTRWAQTLGRGETIHPFEDMVMAPVPLDFACNVLRRLIASRLPGIVQVSGERDVTYAEVARHIARSVGAMSELVEPINSKEAGVPPESVPAHTTLDTTRLRVELGLEPPSVWTTIDYAIGL